MQVTDPVTGRCGIVMEYIEGAHNLWGVFGKLEEIARPDLERPILLGEDIVTAYQVTKMVISQLGDFHGHFWMDSELR